MATPLLVAIADIVMDQRCIMQNFNGGCPACRCGQADIQHMSAAHRHCGAQHLARAVKVMGGGFCQRLFKRRKPAEN